MVKMYNDYLIDESRDYFRYKDFKCPLSGFCIQAKKDKDTMLCSGPIELRLKWGTATLMPSDVVKMIEIVQPYIDVLVSPEEL
jgi:hypothetical protein